jgi:hypothetical protein
LELLVGTPHIVYKGEKYIIKLGHKKHATDPWDESGEKCKLKKRVLFFQLFVSPTFHLSHSTRVTRRLKKS